MADPIGPVYEGNIEEFVVNEGGLSYRIMYLPDKNNSELQREGKSPYYYWMPKDVRIARRSDTGDYKFHLLHFVGVQSSESTVGVTEGTREVAGGVLSVTITAEPPPGILEKAHEQLRAKFQGSDNRYWGWRTPAAPKFGGIPLASSRVSISNLSPNVDGTVPGTTTAGPATTTGTTTPTTPAASTTPSSPTASTTPTAPSAPGRLAPPGGAMTAPPSQALTPRLMKLPRTINEREMSRERSNLDAWFVKMEGQGPGSIDAGGENAFTALLGSYPTAILWQGFRGVYSPVSVVKALKIKVWSENIHLRIRGSWDRIFQHFSANASGRAWWFSADIKAEFNNLVINGGITVDLMIDGTTPGADKMRETINKRIDLIIDKFMKQAEKRIFEPAPPEVKPAEASTGGWLSGLFGGGGGVALKYRRDETHLNLEYEESLSERYILDHVISSTLEGFFSELQADAASERKYFTTLYLDDWDRKVTRIVKPVVNWPDPSQKWIGEPVSFLSCQIGYPNAAGELQWVGQMFQAAQDTPWRPSFAMKKAADVVNPPSGWAPDMTFVKRKVHFLEPPGESDYPYMRAFVEKNEVDLDPEPNGTPMNDITLEVRADSVGKLEVGPLFLNVELENSKQFVEISFRCLGRTHDGLERPVVKFTWKYEDQNQPRYWEIFTGQPDFVPAYQYQVRVVIKGTLFSKGMEWIGPWEDVAGNGPLMTSVPTPEEAVSTRRLSARESTQIGFEAPPTTITGQPSMVTPPAGRVAAPPTGRPRLTELTVVPGSRVAAPPSATGTSSTSRTSTSATSRKEEEDLPLVSGWSVAPTATNRRS